MMDETNYSTYILIVGLIVSLIINVMIHIRDTQIEEGIGFIIFRWFVVTLAMFVVSVVLCGVVYTYYEYRTATEWRDVETGEIISLENSRSQQHNSNIEGSFVLGTGNITGSSYTTDITTCSIVIKTGGKIYIRRYNVNDVIFVDSDNESPKYTITRNCHQYRNRKIDRNWYWTETNGQRITIEINSKHINRFIKFN